jgi:hypothetical protein
LSEPLEDLSHDLGGGKYYQKIKKYSGGILQRLLLNLLPGSGSSRVGRKNLEMLSCELFTPLVKTKIYKFSLHANKKSPTANILSVRLLVNRVRMRLIKYDGKSYESGFFKRVLRATSTTIKAGSRTASE